jgi:16S rRNA (cytosine1402-N4)-methyltransferase
MSSTPPSAPIHIPVLLKEILEMFSTYPKAPEQMFDGTFGRGGHSRALLEAFPSLKVQAVDKDVEAIEYAHKNFKKEIEAQRLRLFQGSFADFVKSPESSKDTYDLMLLDLGVSSPQLDQAQRGFSFYHDGPLDMRMNLSQITTAAEIINEWDEEDLIEIFQKYGEIRSPFRVIRAILNDRHAKPFTSTQQLAGLIERVDGWRQKGRHPATQYFMALRLKVNQELEHLEQSLEALMQALVPGGVMAVITFHSLEDRIVKTIFRNNEELGRPINKKVIVPSDEEEKSNPRSRSAKLRFFRRHNLTE